MPTPDNSPPVDDTSVAPAPELRRFMLSNARCACALDFCQLEALGQAKCVGFCNRCGSDMAIKASGGAPTRPT
jgi:hypothetical protein